MVLNIDQIKEKNQKAAQLKTTNPRELQTWYSPGDP
jgi:hypothetical protein